MIAPKLNKGDAIGVFSPSSPATATARVRYGRGKAYLESIVANKASFPHVLPTPDAWTDEFLDWETQDRAKRPVASALVTVCGGKAEGRLVAGNLNTMEGF